MAAHLFVVFLAARLALLARQSLPLSPWTPFAFIWQDIAIVLVFFLFERAVKRQWVTRAVYGALVLVAAANVPVGLVLSSPLTAPILRAARGAMADSIGHEARFSTIALTLAVLLLGAALPVVWRPREQMRRPALAVAFLILLVGPFAARRVDTRGLERNPIAALVRTSIPRVQAETLNSDWRLSLSPIEAIEDFSSLRGRAAGLNVLMVVLESTGAQYLRPFGAVTDPMPNLTALAARAIVFDNAYAVYPESIKEIIAIMSSRYPALDVPAERHSGVAAPSLASALGTANYKTALFHSGRFAYLGMDRIVAQLGFHTLADAGDLGGRRDSSFGVDEPSAVEHVLKWIDGLPAGQRFFATYLPIAGHHPYTYAQPGPFANDEEVDRYRNSLYDGDRAIGQLLAGLRARGLERSTMIVVMADHGEAFGQHEGNYGHNLALYEENVRVPLLIALPEAERATHVQRAASLLDVAPTVLELLALPAESVFQGESLLSPRARAALFFTDYSLALVGLRDACFKFIHELESGRSKLFDVCHDPAERADQSEQFPERVSAYRARLRAWSAAQVANVTRYAER